MLLASSIMTRMIAGILAITTLNEMITPPKCPCFNTHNIGALIIRIGFGAHYTIVIIRNAQNIIGNYLGPYIHLEA